MKPQAPISLRTPAPGPVSFFNLWPRLNEHTAQEDLSSIRSRCLLLLFLQIILYNAPEVVRIRVPPPYFGEQDTRPNKLTPLPLNRVPFLPGFSFFPRQIAACQDSENWGTFHGLCSGTPAPCRHLIGAHTDGAPDVDSPPGLRRGSEGFHHEEARSLAKKSS